MSKTISLNNGKVAIVDDADFDAVNQRKWYALQPKPGTGSWYAHSPINRGEPGYRKYKLTRIYLHHFVMGKPEDGLEVDHINRNGLDCRRENMRFVTHAENCLNRCSTIPAEQKAEYTKRYNREYYRTHKEQLHRNSLKYYLSHREEILSRKKARRRELQPV